MKYRFTGKELQMLAGHDLALKLGWTSGKVMLGKAFWRFKSLGESLDDDQVTLEFEIESAEGLNK